MSDFYMTEDPTGKGCEKMVTTYEDMFPGACLHIETKSPTCEKSYIGPPRLVDLIKYLFAAGRHPKWTKISHLPLLKYVQLVFFDGLDESIFQKYYSSLSEFHEIMGNGFPLPVISSAKEGTFTNGVDSVIGLVRKLKTKVAFKSFEEMLASQEQLVDNGFPLKDGPVLDGKLRFEHFRLARLTESDLNEYEVLPESFEGDLDVIALDCEMIETNLGDECARLTVVNESGQEIMNQFFRPLGDIIDLRTEVSGIRQEDIDSAKTTSYEVVAALSKIASQRTIIIGHSLENDFRAMKLIHKRVIDTSLVYNRDCQYPHKPGLAKLYQRYIKRPFRVGLTTGHDSAEDARAALELAKHAMKIAIHQKVLPPQLPTLYTELLEKIVQINVFEGPLDCLYAGLDQRVTCEVNEDDSILCQKFVESVERDKAPLTVVHFGELAHCEIEEDLEKTACENYNKYMKRIRESMPPGSITIIYSGTGNMNRLKVDMKTLDPRHQLPGRDPNRKEEFEKCRKGLCWILCTNAEASPDV